MKRFLSATVVAMAGALAGSGIAAAAEPFPSRPVTIVVPYSAGGGTDAIGRKLGQALTAYWKQPVVVENVPGADGVVGTQRVLHAPADGYTLLVQLNQMLLWPWTTPSAKVDIRKDFRLISKIQHSPEVIAVSAKFPGSTLKEFVAWCQKADTPCSWGTATQASQLAGEQLMDAAGIRNSIHLSYKGTAPMITDLIGGHITMGMATVASAMGHVKAGTLKLLAVGSRDRFATAGAVPTLVEQGYPVECDTWYGIMVSRDTPQPAVDAITTALNAISKEPELQKAIEAGGGAPIWNSPQQFQREVDEEIHQLTPVLAKLKPGGS